MKEELIQLQEATWPAPKLQSLPHLSHWASQVSVFRPSLITALHERIHSCLRKYLHHSTSRYISPTNGY